MAIPICPSGAKASGDRALTLHDFCAKERLLVKAKTGTGLHSRPMVRDPTTSGSAQTSVTIVKEQGRIERTIHALNWLEQPQLRRQATAELNKGESHNALSRAVCFHRLGRLHDRTAQAQQNRASGLALVTAAIVLWNTLYLGRAFDVVRRRGEIVPDINLTGDYLWGADAHPAPDGFRPLKGTSANPPLTKMIAA